MIKNWKLRIALSLAIFIPLELLCYDLHEGMPFSERIAYITAPFAFAILFVSADHAEEYPDKLARSFTATTRLVNGLDIRATWLSATLSIGPGLPVLLWGIYVGLSVDLLASPSRHGVGAFFAALMLLPCIPYLLYYMCSGFRCDVRKNYVRWVSVFFGKEVRNREFKDVRIIEYALGNSGGGGPVVTIEFDDGEGGRKTRKLRFRNLYKCSREEFCDILAEYLGQPDRITSIPTKRGHRPLLVENS